MLGDSAKLVIYGVSDVGQMREHNEDHIAWDKDMGLVIVADGMGGHNAGEVASEIAVNSIQEVLRDVLDPEMQVSDSIDLRDAVREAITYANDEINRQARENFAYNGMGTTIVLNLFQGDRVISAHVGDSRAYRLRDDKLEQITTDHSLVQEMVDNGYLSQEEAQLSASRNLITRALGIADTVEVDVNEEKVAHGDMYLMCTDGLTDLVNDDEIISLLRDYRSETAGCNLEGATQALVGLANDKGGKDNISVVMVCLQQAFSDSIGLEDD
ncbi:Stp1/IreP family PP2C-type Ser/Thr phosphatase [Thiohalophilus sp.]|uniref:Stp1/IreP family PP2C-type Ser/Thr phosphatase n=1 Tax=Thiohalophilus sp. TaxID=3028392 RepID=UPI00397661AE